ncbi:MAG TPA: hypothetical protein VGI13_03810, partial [Candidatus Acidoferrum sp.]
MKQLGVWAILGIWALLSLGGALFAAWQGYGGRAFATTVVTFTALLFVMLIFAARGVADRLVKQFGPSGGFLLGAII